MKIAYDAKRYFHNKTGLGNYSRTIVEAVKKTNPDAEALLYDEGTFRRTFRLGHIAAKDGCQIFHGLSNELPRDIESCGMPSIVTMHDVAWRTFPDMYTAIDRQIYDMKYGWSARHATKVLCISESTKRDVMRFYGVPEDRIHVIYQPVQQAFYTPMDATEARSICDSTLPYLRGREFILTVGSINSRKNLMAMVQALDAIDYKERPMFVVVGNGRDYRRKVEEYIERRGLRPFVRIETNIHDARTLQALYTSARCLLYPSFYEGFGLPVVEAQLQGCPVITSNVSSLPEAGGPGAIQVDPTSVSDLADALNRLLHDSVECQQRGSEGHDYCLRMFHPDALAQQVVDLYNSLI